MQRQCRVCRGEFEVSSREQDFLGRVAPAIAGRRFDIPLPSLCPTCRLQRRMSWRNERTLYARKCSKSGESLISAYAPTVPFPILKNELWWKDDNDALVFGRDVDWSRGIFAQMLELQNVVPQGHSFNYAEDRMVNSSFTNCAGDLKDCYLIFASGRDEKCMYCNYTNDSYACVDCFFCLKSTHCYECTDIEQCNSIYFSQSCKECFDGMYLYDCRGCSRSIGCVGLRQKQYYILNEKSTKAEYEQTWSALLNGDLAVRQRILEGYQTLLATTPRKNLHGDRNENCSGDFIWNSRNCINCYDTFNAEDCINCTWFTDGKDSMDVYSWGETELCYEVSGGGEQQYHCGFTVKSYGCKESWYLNMCVYCKNCLACVGLKHKQYCILNKQLSKDEYEALAPKVIELMQAHNEWGEFFPAKHSPWGYNESVAIQYYPLSREAAQARGFWWSDYSAPAAQVKTVKASSLPSAISQTGDDILESAIECEVTAKPFRVTREELKFYRDHGLSLPRRHPDQRHADRVALRNPRVLWKRHCEQCGVSIETTYSPDRPEQVFCEECYLKTVYQE